MKFNLRYRIAWIKDVFYLNLEEKSVEIFCKKFIFKCFYLKKSFYEMLKKIWLIIFIIVAVWTIYMAHQISFESREVNFFGAKKNVENMFPNFYAKYWMFKNEDPTFVRKNSIFSKYQDYCSQNHFNCIIFPQQQLYADIVWISSIQYLWWVLDNSKTPYLYDMLDNITNLNWHWAYPYVFGQLLLPVSKTNDVVPLKDRAKTRDNTISLWEKWKKYICDKQKVEKISALSTWDFYRIVNNTWSKEYNELKNPCDSSDFSNYLAFNYFYYAGDWKNSANFYKVASFAEDAPLVSSSMVAVVSGRWWQHITSMQIWFTQFLSLIEKSSKATTEDEKQLYDSKVNESLNKSLFEYQLSILQDIDNQKKCSHDYYCLLQIWRIKEKLSSDITACQSYKNTDLDLQKIAQTVSEKDSDFTDKVKCILLWYGIKNKFIDMESWDLVYPLNEGKDDWKYQFKYWWDYDLQDWWIK